MMTRDIGALVAGKRRVGLEDGSELRLLSAMELLEARREAGELALGGRERALCANACLLARAWERGGRAVHKSGEAVLRALTPGEIGALAGQWAELDRGENPSAEDGEARCAPLKEALEGESYERLKWRVLRAFGALPTEARAREMTDRDYLWCALHLTLDDEEALDALCPACRGEALSGRCPVCGGETGGDGAGENAAFDEKRFERLRRGESG